MYKHYSKYFYGNPISDYGIANKRFDYRTLAKSFQHILNNNIISKIYDWEPVNGFVEKDGCDYLDEIFQWYIISDEGSIILQELTDENLLYSPSFDIYLWGVTHFGTSWDYVLTDIELELNE